MSIPKGESITLAGSPSIGDGRYGRVIRFHTSNTQYAQVVDTGHIDYLQGMISFYYQMDMGNSSDSGAGAEFFARIGSADTQFKLYRNGSEQELIFSFGDTTGDSTGPNRTIWSCVDSFIVSIDTIADDTVWRKYDFSNPFDGNQHHIRISWNYSTNTVSLTVDGKELRKKRSAVFNSNPQTWAVANLRFGRNIDGYLENLTIRSRTFEPQPGIVTRINIDTIQGYLPFIQPGFKDTVDCIVICPEDSLFRKECDRYALRNISMGIRTVVVSLSEIKRYYTGSDEQERIRNFLKQAYLKWYPKYLVLAGSTDLIPSRKVAFESKGGHIVTTDRYYACLEGTWNDDGDQYFAEPQDNTDMTTELVVARFPAATWNELYTMIERSNMGFGLPPYNEQCTGNSDTVMLTGIRMFNDINNISDGHYYCNHLKNVLDRGAYTSALKIRTYFPNDDSSNNDTDAMHVRLGKFINKLDGFPHLWIHYGHGNYGNATVDKIGKEHVWLEPSLLKEHLVFNRFRNIGHVRLVGCEAASQDLNSIARTFLAKSYGGALTYIGTSEYSYPSVESQLLIEECRNMSDSSIFTWGDLFRKSAEKILGNNSSWDIAKWVVLSRNFMGDPLLPVRSGKIESADTLKITLSGNIRSGINNLTVTVKDKNNRPVEGAQVGIAPLTISRSTTDTLGYMGKTYSDLTFGRCITNRYGQGTLSFTLLHGDSMLCLTATHPNFLSTRITAPCIDSAGSGITSYLYYMFDADSVHQYGNNNGIAESGENVHLVYIVSADRLLDSASVNLDTLGSGIHAILNSKSFYQISGLPVYRLSIRTSLLSCRPGTGRLGIKVKYYSGSTVQDSAIFSIPVTGPDIVPVITYLPDNVGDYTPGSGDNIRMCILLGNRYSAEACNVQCRLVTGSPYVNITNDTTEHIGEVRPFSEVFDQNIRYSIIGGYSEEVNGIIPAKLVITADNMENDTVDIDLNPLRNVTFDIDRNKVELDYNQGVRLTWNPIKVDENKNRHSDFLGYVVMRKVYGDTTDDYTLLTPWAVTSTNYYYDKLPDNSEDRFTYRIAVVDSSFNCSVEDTVDVTRPAFIKPSFPIRTAAIMKAPSIGSFDKSGIAGIYAIAGSKDGVVNAFRANGQEAVVNGANDGVFTELKAWQTAQVDIDNDGIDDAVFVTGDSIIGWNKNTKSSQWAHCITNSPHIGPVSSYRKPVIADIDGDGDVEIIVFYFDNRGNGATTLDIFTHNGSLLARRNFADCSYPTAIAVGDFVKGTGHNGLEIAFITIPYVNPTNWIYYLYVLEYSTGKVDVIDSAYVCHAMGGIVEGDSLTRIPYSGLSAADLDNDGNIELIFCMGGFPHSTTIGDSLFVFRINSTSGSLSRVDQYPVNFMNTTIFGSSPAIADIDLDGKPDIVMATDDSIYILKLESGKLSPIVPIIQFGLVPANRLNSGYFTPQALVTKRGDSDSTRIFVNHQGDGSIWAFDIDNDGSAWQANRVPGYPLKTRGRISEAIAVTDLEGEGILDLTAVDDAGYIYAWKIGPGSVYRQPWPVQYGNNWNTGYNGYKDPGISGYLYEDWKEVRTAPYRWFESDSGGVIDSVATSMFVMSNGVLQTSSAGGRNLHFVGPSTNNWKDYTVSGKIKFDNPSARFGINLYSSYADSARKYSVIRRPDGKVEWLLYTGADTKTVLKVSDSVLVPHTGVWYNYKACVINHSSYNRIRAEFWPEGEGDPTINEDYRNWDIDAVDTTPSISRLKTGRVGVFSDSGTGTRYWGSIKVVTNTLEEGAYMAYEQFTEDTVVDIAPYTPRNLSPDYGCIRLDTGYDTTGFVFDKLNKSLSYKHKPGSQYPVTCKVAPYTNLQWSDYAFSGKIVKPIGAVYDSIWVGVDVYSSGGNQYRAKFRNDTMIVEGGGISDTVTGLGGGFDNGDTLYFRATAITGDLQDKTFLIIEVNINNPNLVSKFDNRLTGGDILNNIKGGIPAVYLDLNGKERSATGVIRIDDIQVQKIR